MNRRVFVLIISAVVIAALLWITSGESEPKNVRFDPERYIAHAGGAIGGYKYTNSLEAVEQSIARGFKYIEIDLLMTADSILVAGHDWESLNKMTKYDGGDAPQQFSDFMQRKIYDRYTPMSYREIDSIFLANPNLYLVTDKISDPQILNKFLPNLKSQMCIEVFGGVDEYLELERMGFYRPMLSGLPNGSHFLPLLDPGFYKVRYIVKHTNAVDSWKIKLNTKITGAKLVLWTTNDTEWMDRHLGKEADMIYTDTYIVNKGDVDPVGLKSLP